MEQPHREVAERAVRDADAQLSKAASSRDLIVLRIEGPISERAAEVYRAGRRLRVQMSAENVVVLRCPLASRGQDPSEDREIVKILAEILLSELVSG